MGERTSVNQDHALWYEFNESGQSTAVKSGFWTGDHPAEPGRMIIRRSSSGAKTAKRDWPQSWNRGNTALTARTWKSEGTITELPRWRH